MRDQEDLVFDLDFAGLPLGFLALEGLDSSVFVPVEVWAENFLAYLDLSRLALFLCMAFTFAALSKVFCKLISVCLSISVGVFLSAITLVADFLASKTAVFQKRLCFCFLNELL